MRKLLYALVMGLVGAGIVHIAVLLIIPAYSRFDAWSRLSAASDYYDITRIGGGDGAIALGNGSDPLFEAAACRFDLDDGIVHIRGSGRVPFWSISVYDRVGQNIFSLNDRTATGHVLDVAILTPAQMLDIRRSLPAEFQESVFVEAKVGQGIAVVRGFVPDETWTAIVSDYLDGITCEPRPLG